MSIEQPSVPVGLCQCGCGESTPPYKASAQRRGIVQGEPMHYLPGHVRRRVVDLYRVEDRGFSTPCWIWRGAVHPRSGYGDIRRKELPIRRAHRFFYIQACGPTELPLHHLCEVKLCVNPAHLQPVSHAEHKKLHPNRRGCYAAKLNPGQVREIRRLVAAGASQSAVAREFGITRVSVNNVVNRRTWADVAD